MKPCFLLCTAALIFSSAAPAATLKAALLVPADDARLTRSRLERAFLGHPGGPALEGLQMAIADGKLELDGNNTGVSITTFEVSDPASARASAIRAEKEGASVLLTDLPAAWTLAVADAAPKLPVINEIGRAHV